MIARSLSIRWRWLLPGVVLLALVAESSGRALNLPWLTAASPHVQFALLCAGIVLVVIGLTPHPIAGTRYIVSLRRGEILAILALTLLALVLRLLYIGDTIRVLVDELNFVSGTVSFFKPTENIGLLNPMTGVSPFTWLFNYWQADAVAAFGRSIASVRAVSAVVGALMVPALYFLARTLFSRRIALLAALLLLTFPPHLHFSRISLNNIADPLIGTLALAFLARGVRHQCRLDYALAGAFLGLTQYFYEGGRLLFPALVVAWLVGMWIIRPHPKYYSTGEERLKKTPPLHDMERGLGGEVSHLFSMALAALLVSAPVFYAWTVQSDPLAGRMTASGLNPGYWAGILSSPSQAVAHLTDHILPAFLVYCVIPEATAYYGGHTPFVLLPLAPFFLLGVAAALGRFRHPGNLLLLLWLVLTALGNSLLVISHASTRYVVVFPAIVLMIALGVDVLWSGLERRFHTPIQVKMAVPLVIVTLLALAQLAYYFGPHLGSFDADFRRTRRHRDIEDAVYRSLDFPPGTEIHIISRATFDRGYAGTLLNFFRSDLHATGYQGSVELIADLPNLSSDVPHAFFIEPEDIATLQGLQAQFALEGPFLSPYNIPPESQFVMFYVPVQQQEQGVHGDSFTGQTSLPGGDTAHAHPEAGALGDLHAAGLGAVDPQRILFSPGQRPVQTSGCCPADAGRGAGAGYCCRAQPGKPA